MDTSPLLLPPRRSDGPSGSPHAVRGFLLGCAGFLIGALPVIYALYVLSGFWTALADLTPKPVSVQPRGMYAVSAGATGVGLAVCCPFALLFSALARRSGSKVGTVFAQAGSLLFLFPFPLVLVGLPVICWLAGVELRY
jgi:hypothetical protein